MPSVQLHREHLVYGPFTVYRHTNRLLLPAHSRPARGKVKGSYVLLAVLLVSWLTIDYTIYDVGTRSITWVMLAAAGFGLLRFKMTAAWLIAPLLSTAVALAVALTYHSGPRPWTHLLSQLLAIVVGAGAAGLDWERHIKVLHGTMLVIAIPVLLYAAYQTVARAVGLPFAYLPVTNQQMGCTYQRGYGGVPTTRASSVFTEPSDLGYFSLWLLCIGLSSARGRMQRTALLCAVAGLVLSQSLGAIIGASLLFVVYVVKKRRVVPAAQVLMAGLIVFAAASLWLSAGLQSFVDRVTAAASLNPSADSARVSKIPELAAVAAEAPLLGHGLSSSATLPRGVGALGYLTLGIERGLLGTLLYLLPFVWAFSVLLLSTARDESAAINTALLLAVLNLYSFSNFAMFYFPPQWLALGMTLWAARRVLLVRGGHRGTKR